MDIKKTLIELCSAYGVSGDEFSASDVAKKYLSKYMTKVTVDGFGNVYGDMNFGRKKRILLDAHIDQIGFIINYVTEDGFLKFSPVGGVDTRLLPAQKVYVISPNGDISGVITSVPPHISKGDEKATNIDDLYIDTGLDGDTAKRNIPLGTRAVFCAEPKELLGDRITSPAIDDRAGVVTILRALELVGKDSGYDISVAFSCMEETGESGAKMTSYNAECDLAIAVDVSFANAKGEDKNKCGEMGKGAMIGISPTLSKEMSKALIKLAEKNNIPYQTEVMSGETGTDADAIGVSRSGVMTATVSVPIKYMHTPVEVVSVSDIENSARLIAEFLKDGTI